METGKRRFKAREIAPVPWLSEDRKTARLNTDRSEPVFRQTEAILISEPVALLPMKRVRCEFREKPVYGKWVNPREFVIG